MRYLAFALVSGHPLSLVVIAYIILTNFGQVKKFLECSKDKYGQEFVDYASKVPTIIPIVGRPALKSQAHKAD